MRLTSFFNFQIVTMRIRSMTLGYVFTGVWLLTQWNTLVSGSRSLASLWSHVLSRGYPSLSSHVLSGECPGSGPMSISGGTPVLSQVPHDMGIPQLGLAYPPALLGLGYLSPGTPSPDCLRRGQYVSRGFPQENFLV